MIVQQGASMPERYPYILEHLDGQLISLLSHNFHLFLDATTEEDKNLDICIYIKISLVKTKINRGGNYGELNDL